MPRSDEYFSDGSWKFKFVRGELINNRILRQGWGIEDLRKGVDAFIAANNERCWGGSPEDRFDILKPMLEIEVGTPIVVPKFSIRNGETRHGRYFTIVICTKVYDFAFPNNICEQDFDHFIDVDPKMVTYDYDVQPAVDVKAYRKAINRVRDKHFKNAVASLI